VSALLAERMLTSLPRLPLEHIASHLQFEDLVQLASSSQALAHLQPRVQEVTEKEFSIHGPYYGDFVPEPYVDVAVITQGLESVWMEFDWKDQGYGNQKGQIWLQLVRDGRVIADSREQYFALAPHNDLERREVEVVEHPVVTLAGKGDVIRVMRNVGGGGGHRLTVKNFKMRIIHKRELAEDSTD